MTLGIQLCGPRGIRTPDLLNAIETRSQLRYGPKRCFDLREAITEGIVSLWT